MPALRRLVLTAMLWPVRRTTVDMRDAMTEEKLRQREDGRKEHVGTYPGGTVRVAIVETIKKPHIHTS